MKWHQKFDCLYGNAKVKGQKLFFFLLTIMTRHKRLPLHFNIVCSAGNNVNTTNDDDKTEEICLTLQYSL